MRPLALAFAIAALPFAACASERAVAAADGLAPGVVDVATAKRLVEQGIRVVDVRTPAEYAAGHVPGAVNIPFDEVDRRHAELGSPSSPVLLYCRSGRRSGIAQQVLQSKGFSRVYDFQVFDRWVQAGGPEARGSAPSP